MSGASNLGHQVATHRKKPMADLTAADEWSSEFRDKLHGNTQTQNHQSKMKSNDQEVEKKNDDEQGKENKNRKKNKKTTRNKDNARQEQTSHRDKSNVSSPDLLVFVPGLKTTVKMPGDMSAVMSSEVRLVLTPS